MKSRTHADALRGRLPMEPGKLIERLDTAEMRLDRADRVILEQARAIAAKAFQFAKAPDRNALVEQWTLIGAELEALRGAVSETLAAARDATGEFRAQAARWLETLPDEVRQEFVDHPWEEPAGEVPDLHLPPPPPASAGQACEVADQLPELLGSQSRAIDELTGRASTLRSRLEG